MRFLTAVPLLLLSAASAVSGGARVTLPFDRDWRFLKADAPGAEAPGFDHSAWRTLDVPHDWSIEGPFDQDHRTGGQGAFLPGGAGWYRKRFHVPADWSGRRVFIEFDGVMANSDVWINGAHLGKRPSGYVSFRYELTDHLKPGEANVVAVRADNSAQPASRWYTGAGIYRHVRLIAAGPVHLDAWSTFVTTPKVAPGRATVRVASRVMNQSEAVRIATLRITLLAPDGRAVATAVTAHATIPAGKTAGFTQDIALTAPEIWDIDHPFLYRAAVEVRDGKTVLDDETVAFGVREFRFESASGFWLNGRNLKLHGVCLHHDAGALGAAVPLRAWERRLQALRELGVNAIRTAHNPVAPEFLDLCDRMGFLVMDEMFDTWLYAKQPYDYHLFFEEWSKIDTRDIVRRDRNHPSVILYSAGNEIRDTPKADVAKRILGGLIEVFHQNDPTRPVTQGLFRPNVSHDYDNGLADMLDVVGQNYRENELLAAHAAKPSRKILGTENGHDRRVWVALRDSPQMAGQFLWAGIDYLGEARRWPDIASEFGLLDRTGFPKPLAFERQSWWTPQPMIGVFRRVAPRQATPADPGYEPDPGWQKQTLRPDWTPRDASAHEETVEVYSNCEQVELLLNSRSLGVQPLPADAAPRTWRVSFEPGTLKAVGRSQGAVAVTRELRTAGKAARIALTVDRATLAPEWDDVAYVVATVVDDNGVPAPGDDPQISFRLYGPGAVAAVDNGDNTSHEPFQATSRRAYLGRAVAIVRATAGGAPIRVVASAAGLADGSLTIDTQPPQSLRFHFGGKTPPRSTGVSPSTIYSADAGYGFEPESSVSTGARRCAVSDKPFYYSVARPEGNYRVTMTLGDRTSVKAELRRLMVESSGAETRTMIVNVRRPSISTGGEVRLKDRERNLEARAWDDKLTLEFDGARPSVCALEIARADDAPTIYLAGDSTVTDQPREPYSSWGQMLTRFFAPEVAIANHAESGESLRSFIDEKRLDKIMGAIKPGDYLFIQMGHNDQKLRGEGVGAFTTYQAQLKHMIAETRAHGATPVLITPVNRRTFDVSGKIANSLGDFPEAVRRAAAEDNVPLIDLHAMSATFYEALGPDLSLKAFVPGDGTHHNNYGAYELARCVVQGIRKNRLDIARFLVRDAGTFDPAHPDPPDRFSLAASPSGPTVKPYGN